MPNSATPMRKTRRRPSRSPHLIGYLAREDLADDARLRAEAVVLDLLHPLPALPIDVPLPVDERVRAVTDALLADPSDSRSLDDHARAIGASRRTLTRLFARDTGLSFDRWRTHMRLRAALPLLAEGRPVSQAAHAVGYATPSAFLAAFRRTVGTSPGATSTEAHHQQRQVLSDVHEVVFLPCRDEDPHAAADLRLTARPQQLSGADR
ncbi:AraC-like DNA-binding protein [Nonomuraea polychroma]|uniref:HTH-type transcriptional regulator RipA n=1 Tax=Nonomuraea polychroma TaxID=46176 RepID=A0A438MAE3_9ACTN|nr:AraC family transcriptional regulator [Nonomuraea polychroma]RVX42702.1 AraC-like DNA-binding protein [Nonomuraea polychroma]